ncbi:16S rRNA (cytidine(1402)-2'-O)-methyltransferase [Rhodothalassium salexigens]|uniref:16S rRNA (cytidine(1402)-2'-O)-methyltransferase n=1 Tax=Rhodothalassium salexigens TaxID=1086 RepID=UPI0019129809|nr:16S rRNA (cytidine(1402)-2'-O)-methyltransferase [Rhodothalassium salexigens]MBK5921405.1 16S rRNA (cytidine(1402)-2'-O)-methyltransferase [Rhodothalassium salexigens]
MGKTVATETDRSDTDDSGGDDADGGAAGALAPGLYVVATPIGNLGDMTERAVAVLRAADRIACEDSRVTRKLAQRFAIHTPMTAYHDHSAPAVRARLLDDLAQGARIALVSDAGTPLLADPGYKLVADAVAADIPVIPIPGASALLAALTVAGLPTDRFLFAGFPPPKQAKRQKAFGAVAAEPGTLVFYESPQRLAACLADMARAFGARPACVCREMTKRFEEVRRGPLDALADHYAQAGAPKGEVVIVVAGAAPEAADDARLDALLADALATLSVREAAHAVAWVTGLPRRTVYNRALRLADDGGGD